VDWIFVLGRATNGGLHALPPPLLLILSSIELLPGA